MTDRIPSSINWLIKQHQSLNCEIADVERELLKLKCLKRSLEEELNAVNRVIKRHEIPIDPDDIPARKYHRGKTKFRYGELTTGIYKCLQSYSLYEGATCADITSFIISHLNIDFTCKADLFALREKVRKRLFNLVKKGTVYRTSNKKLSLYFLTYNGLTLAQK